MFFHNGYIYESTGLYGSSSLRQVNLADGQVLQQVDLPAKYFGEGITLVGDRIFQLTWKEQQGFVYDLNSFTKLDQFYYPTEGWGLTYDGEFLIMSDGSAQLSFIDPKSYQIINQITVIDEEQPVEMLNELEYINGFVYANIWLTDRIVIVDPSDGQVQGWINLSGLLDNDPSVDLRNHKTDVLNGIAYDSDTDRLFVTGKLWPRLYQIELIK